MPSVVRIHHFPQEKSAGWSCKVLNVDASRRKGKDDSDTVCFCGSSSVDRALAFQAKGREFEPRLPLHYAAACDANASVERWGVCVARLFCEMNFKTLGQFLTIL